MLSASARAVPHTAARTRSSQLKFFPRWTRKISAKDTDNTPDTLSMSRKERRCWAFSKTSTNNADYTDESGRGKLADYTESSSFVITRDRRASNRSHEGPCSPAGA